MGVQSLQTFVTKGFFCELKTYTPTSPSPPLILDAANVSRFISKNHSDPCYGGSPELLYRECKRILGTLQRCSQPGMVLVCGSDSSSDNAAKRATTIDCGKEHMRELIADIHSFNMAPMVRPIFFNVAKELGIEIINCDSNDDVATARLALDRNGLVVSEDSDFCIFDVPGVLNVKSLTCDRNGEKFQAPLYERRSLATKLNIDDSLLPLWASLCGNDFLRGGPDGVLQEFHDRLAREGRFYTTNRFKLMEAVATFLGKYVGRTGVPCKPYSLARELHARSPAKAEQMCDELRYSLAFYGSPSDANTAELYSPSRSALELMGSTAGPDGALVCRTMPPRMVERFRCAELSMVPTADFCKSPSFIPCIPYGHRIGDSSPHYSRSKLRGDALFMLFRDHPDELVFQCQVPNLNSIEYDDDSVTLSSLRTADRECLPSIFTIYGDQPPSGKELRDLFTQRFGVTPAEATEFEGLLGELPDWSARLLNSCALKYYARECREPANEAEVIVFACCIARQQQEINSVDEHLRSLSVGASGARFQRLRMADDIAEQHIFSCVNRWIEICGTAFSLHRVLDSPLGKCDPRLVLFNGREVFSVLNDLYAAGKAGAPIPLHKLLSKVLGTSNERAKRMVGWIYTLVTAGRDGFRAWDSIDCVALTLPHRVVAPLPQQSAAMPARQAPYANASTAPAQRATAVAAEPPSHAPPLPQVHRSPSHPLQHPQRSQHWCRGLTLGQTLTPVPTSLQHPSLRHLRKALHMARPTIPTALLCSTPPRPPPRPPPRTPHPMLGLAWLHMRQPTTSPRSSPVLGTRGPVPFLLKDPILSRRHHIPPGSSHSGAGGTLVVHMAIHHSKPHIYHICPQLCLLSDLLGLLIHRAADISGKVEVGMVVIVVAGAVMVAVGVVVGVARIAGAAAVTTESMAGAPTAGMVKLVRIRQRPSKLATILAAGTIVEGVNGAEDAGAATKDER